MSTEWKWLNSTVVDAIHKSQIARHGGLDGVRDESLIAANLARPQNLAAYRDPDAAELAAAYACGVARSHGFLDGNKRTAWVAARTFLADNGFTIRLDQLDGFNFMQSVADGTIDEPAAADWFRSRLVR